jgi:hypothetical protein
MRKERIMKKIRFIQLSWVLSLAVVVLGVSFITPALATGNSARHSAHTTGSVAGTSIAATIYITSATLQPMFQSHIDQQVPTAMNNAINAMVSKLPKQDQGWAMEMATTLIQPAATVVSLTPQSNGLALTLLLSLYPGDPHPIKTGLLISFSPLNSSTVQVSAGPLNGGPALASGPQSTFSVPIGTLNAVKTTPSCGSAALALNLQIPVALGQAASISQVAATTGHHNPMAVRQKGDTNAGVNTFIEIPASSISSLGSSMGSMPVGNGLTAQNIRVGVNGNNLEVTSDIYWSGIDIGVADTTIAPGAGNGKLVLHVLNTSFSIFGLFTFPMNSYNQQIQQTLNAKLSGAFAGKFTVNSAAIGPDSQLPCAASNSLVISGTSSIGG